MNIKSIKKQSNSKYKIIFDDNTNISLYDDVILNNNILFKKCIDDELMNKIMDENNYFEIYNKAVKLINTRLRSLKEINDYLDKNEVSVSDKNNIINKLTDIGLINDEMYAKSYISDKIYLSNDGPEKIKNNLINLGIDVDLIDSELSKIDDDIFLDKLKKIIEKKFRCNHKYSGNILKKKIITEMINLGYLRSSIEDVLFNYHVDNSNLIKKDYNKLYNKYSRKLSGNDLEKKIKQALYIKGYTSEEISEMFI